VVVAVAVRRQLPDLYTGEIVQNKTASIGVFWKS